MIQPRLEAISGCMFAGKTRTIIDRIRKFEKEGRRISAIKPLIDDRYGTSDIVAHDGERVSATVIGVDDSESLAGVDVLVLDEAQFLSVGVVDRLIYLLATGKINQAVVAGLDLDWRGKPFGQMPRLLCYADSVVKLHAVCEQCGQPANRSFLVRRTSVDQVIQIGGADKYEPRCIPCFEKGMSADNPDVFRP